MLISQVTHSKPMLKIKDFKMQNKNKQKQNKAKRNKKLSPLEF